jgi:hypothetical protein
MPSLCPVLILFEADERCIADVLQHPIFGVKLHARVAHLLQVEDGCRVRVRVWNGCLSVSFLGPW